jgi:hypothetical protein
MQAPLKKSHFTYMNYYPLFVLSDLLDWHLNNLGPKTENSSSSNLAATSNEF